MRTLVTKIEPKENKPWIGSQKITKFSIFQEIGTSTRGHLLTPVPIGRALHAWLSCYLKASLTSQEALWAVAKQGVRMRTIHPAIYWSGQMEALLSYGQNKYISTDAISFPASIISWQGVLINYLSWFSFHFNQATDEFEKPHVDLLDYNLQLDGCPVPSSTVKNMGVVLDVNLSFDNHISNVTKTAFFHLRNISKLRNMLSVSDAEKLVHAFMTSRLDYCNALLGGCPASSINKLQIVQNAAARVLTTSRKYDYITPILQSLHWLPIKFRFSYKILLLAYKALNDLAPAYLTNLLSRYNPTCSLRSQNSGLLVVPRIAKSTKGGRTFSYLAPKLWNSLPENVRGSDTLSLFKSRLKTSV